MSRLKRCVLLRILKRSNKPFTLDIKLDSKAIVLMRTRYEVHVFCSLICREFLPLSLTPNPTACEQRTHHLWSPCSVQAFGMDWVQKRVEIWLQFVNNVWKPWCGGLINIMAADGPRSASGWPPLLPVEETLRHTLGNLLLYYIYFAYKITPVLNAKPTLKWVG